MLEQITSADIDEYLLPESCLEWSGVIGVNNVLKIIAKWGGTRLYVPVAINEQHPIAQLIGIKAAEKLVSYCGGDYIEPPVGLVAKLSIRNAQIKEDNKAMSQSQLARKYNLTIRQIRNILSDCEKNDDQLGLFE
ncbi:MAG: hypothetical protein DYH15_12130 [Nitrosomonas sp. PRO4]|nr:hypothetical protein [Nitrosomonas sp. PRO4]